MASTKPRGRRNVAKAPSATQAVNPKAAGAPGQMMRAAGVKGASAYTPRKTGVLPTGVTFPGKIAMEDVWAGRGKRR